MITCNANHGRLFTTRRESDEIYCQAHPTRHAAPPTEVGHSADSEGVGLLRYRDFCLPAWNPASRVMGSYGRP
jgi:hypothetical protein